ncbi:hypothetical protein AAEU29_20430 [Pseudoalteromonas sp. SSM20]|uniref:hypothetical protein n=1 Tax=Pseudoalteromonas sp. SSM20 TaxID=3139394 RepID=UPI003BAA407F
MGNEVSIEALLHEVMVEHGVKLTKNDPVLIVHTLNKRLIESQKALQESLLNELKSNLEVLTTDWSEEAKSVAENIINSSLKASTATITQAIETSTEENKKLLKEAIEESVINIKDEISGKIKETKTVSVANIFASILTTVSALIVAYAAIF